MAQVRSVVLATRNPGKIREIRQALSCDPQTLLVRTREHYLPARVIGLDEFGEIPEPVEQGATFAQNARDKALYYAKAAGQWCLADDSGLVVDALGGEPGVRSARYAADRCPLGAGRDVIDAANNALLMEQLKDVPEAKRTARFVCHLALADPKRILIETFDTIEGTILRGPRGHSGFGYDPVFFVAEKGCTLAELPSEEKNLISHRGKAMRHFARLLESLMAQESS